VIRPSALQLADAGCGLAAHLSAEAGEGSVATERGTAFHSLIEGGLKGTRTATSPVATQLIALIRAAAGDTLPASETAVRLCDPDAGDLITEGTADVLWMTGASLTVLDVKTGRPEFLPPIDDSLQLHAYALGAALELGAEEYRIGYAIIEPEPRLVWSRVFPAAEWNPILERIKVAAARPPKAVIGPHCDGCFQRKRCPSWLLPAYSGESVLAPFTRPSGLTIDNAAWALQAVGAIRTALKIAEAQLQDFAREHGGIVSDGQTWAPQMRRGRRSISIADCDSAGRTAELEAAGLVKQGQPYEVFGWKRSKTRETR
jgi:hypothetical protein